MLRTYNSLEGRGHEIYGSCVLVLAYMKVDRFEIWYCQESYEKAKLV